MLRLSIALRGRPIKSSGLDRLRATYYVDGKRRRFDTDFHCHIKDWNKKKQSIKAEAKRTPNFKEINKAIREAESRADALDAKCIEEKREVSEAEINHMLAALVPRSSRIKSEMDFYEYFAAYPKNTGLAKNTIRKYKSVKRDLELNFPDLDWHKVTINFYTKWTKKMRERNLKEASIGKNVAVLKSIMQAAHKAKIHTNTAFEHFDAPRESKPTQKRKRVWLTPDQVRILEQAELTDPSLRYARDYFLCGVKSGQRYGDWVQVLSAKAEKTQAGNTIVEIIQEKGNKEVTVHVCETLSKLRKRWQDGFIPEVAYNTLRGHLRKLGELLDLPPLTTHVARRSFGRINWSNGIEISRIQIAFGHAKITETTHYLGFKTKDVRHAVADELALNMRR